MAEEHKVGVHAMLSANEVTVQQAAEILQTTPEEIEQLIRRRLLPSYLHIAPDGSRHRVIPRNVCLQLANSSYSESTPGTMSEPESVVSEPVSPLQGVEEHSATPAPASSACTGDAASKVSSPLERLAAGAALRAERDRSDVAQQVHDSLVTLTDQLKTMEDRLRVAEEELKAILQDARTLLTAMKIQTLEIRDVCDRLIDRLKSGAQSNETPPTGCSAP